jgi:predicted transcriptional regulator
MKNVLAGGSVSILQVLQVLSDRISVDILNAVAEKVTTSDNIIQLLDISARQFYTRHSDLLKIGLIRRRNNILVLTSFGRLIYHSLLIIATSCRHSSELMMVDAVKSTAGIPDNEQKDLIDKLISDPSIKKLLQLNPHRGRI